MLKDSNASILNTFSAPHTYITEHYYNLDESLTSLVNDFIGYVATILGNESQTDINEFSKANDIMKAKLVTIGNAVKGLIGNVN